MATRELLQEITEKLTMLDELRSKAIQAAGVATWIWNPDTNDVVFDEKLLQIFDVSPSEINDSEVFTSSIHPDDLDRITDAIKACQNSPSHFDEVYRVTKKNGSVVQVHSRGDVIPNDPNNRLAGLTWIEEI